MRYAVTVHAHAYTATVTTAATCTTPGVRTYACAGCGESYTEAIPATGHSYVRTEENGNYVYTCTRCGESYTEPIVTTTYRSVSSISSGSSYVITVYSSGKYYALTHTGGALGVTAVTVSNGQIVFRRHGRYALDLQRRQARLHERRRELLPRPLRLFVPQHQHLRLQKRATAPAVSRSGGYYLRYSNGYFSLNRRSASTCYMFEQTN